jgi:hypothetical protein
MFCSSVSGDRRTFAVLAVSSVSSVGSLVDSR